jgi:hypothetical protein
MFEPPVKPLLRRVDTRIGGLYALRMKYNPQVVKFGCSTKSLSDRIGSYRGFTAPCEVLLQHPMPGATKQDILRAEGCLLEAVETVRSDPAAPEIERLDGGNEWYESDDPTVFDAEIRLFVETNIL